MRCHRVVQDNWPSHTHPNRLCDLSSKVSGDQLRAPRIVPRNFAASDYVEKGYCGGSYLERSGQVFGLEPGTLLA